MYKFTALAVAVLAAFGVSGMAVSPALAGTGPARQAERPGHGPSMNISFASGPGSSAHWLARQQAVQLNVGADTGGGSGAQSPEFAEIVVHHFPAAAPTQEPSFAVTGPGSPYLEIDFSGGGYLRRAAGDGSTAWAAYDSSNNVLASATNYAAALAAEPATGSALTVDKVILVDAQVAQGAAFTDTISALQYAGVSLVPRSHRHGHAHHSHGHRGHRHHSG